MKGALRAIAVIAGLGAVAGAGWLLARGGPMPEPPRHTGGAELNPMAAALVESCLAEIAEDPRRAEARARLAMAYDANGLTELAIETYRQALDRRDDEPRWWYHLARAEAGQGRYDAALAAMDRAAALAPDHGPIHWRRGGWLLELGRVDEAAAAFARAAEAAPRDIAPRVGAARVHLQRGAAEAAVPRLEALVRELPDAGYLHQLLGTAYQRTGRLPEAARHLARADGRPPAYPDPWADEVAGLRRSYIASLEEADRLVRAGQAPAALAALEPLQSARPDDPILAAKIGEIRMLGGDLAGARRALDRAVRLDEDSHHAHLHLARLHREQGDLTRAMTHADRAVALHPSLGPAHRERAAILMAGERWPEAEAALAEAIRYGAHDAGTRLDLAVARLRQERFAEAAAGLDAMLEKTPDHLRTVVLAALSHHESGHAERARALLAHARRLAPDDAGVREIARRIEGSGAP